MSFSYLIFFQTYEQNFCEHLFLINSTVFSEAVIMGNGMMSLRFISRPIKRVQQFEFEKWRFCQTFCLGLTENHREHYNQVKKYLLIFHIYNVGSMEQKAEFLVDSSQWKRPNPDRAHLSNQPKSCPLVDVFDVPIEACVKYFFLTLTLKSIFQLSLHSFNYMLLYVLWTIIDNDKNELVMYRIGTNI